MFALLHCTQYEGSDLLGVYSSLDRAVEAARACAEDYSLYGEWLEVHQLELDGAASAGFERREVWSSDAVVA